MNALLDNLPEEVKAGIEASDPFKKVYEQRMSLGTGHSNSEISDSGRKICCCWILFAMVLGAGRNPSNYLSLSNRQDQIQYELLSAVHTAIKQSPTGRTIQAIKARKAVKATRKAARKEAPSSRDERPGHRLDPPNAMRLRLDTGNNLNWDIMFACKTHGNCLVTKQLREDPQLGTWVHTGLALWILFSLLCTYACLERKGKERKGKERKGKERNLVIVKCSLP